MGPKKYLDKAIVPGFTSIVPKSIPLSIETDRSHRQQMTIDTSLALGQLLRTDLLDKFPRRYTLRLKQRLCVEQFESNLRDRFDTPNLKNSLVTSSLHPTAPTHSRVYTRDHTISEEGMKPEKPLCKRLPHKKLRRFYAIQVGVAIEAEGPKLTYYQNYGCGDLEDHTYPISREASATCTTYKWPSKKIVNLKVETFNQIMSLAIGTKWTEQVDLAPKQKMETNEIATLPAIDAIHRLGIVCLPSSVMSETFPRSVVSMKRKGQMLSIPYC